MMSWVEPSSEGLTQTGYSVGSADGLHIPAVALVFPGVLQVTAGVLAGVGGTSGGRDQGVVQAHVLPTPLAGPFEHVGQIGKTSGDDAWASCRYRYAVAILIARVTGQQEQARAVFERPQHQDRWTQQVAARCHGRTSRRHRRACIHLATAARVAGARRERHDKRSGVWLSGRADGILVEPNSHRADPRAHPISPQSGGQTPHSHPGEKPHQFVGASLVTHRCNPTCDTHIGAPRQGTAPSC